MSKKYYWLRLHRDFFKRHDIRVIEEMPNGKDYVLFLLKLMAESVDHEGTLRFSEAIPYSPEMLATVTNTNVDIVRSALKVFDELHLVTVMDDETYWVRVVEKMIGSQSQSAVRMRRKRERDREEEEASHVTAERHIVTKSDVTSISISNSNSKEEEGEKLKGYDKLCEQYGQRVVDDYLERIRDYMASTGKSYKDLVATARNWLKRDNVKATGDREYQAQGVFR